MPLEKKSFTNYTLDDDKGKEKGSVVTIWLNNNERVWLDNMKRIIQQPKDGTALKQLAMIGAKLLGTQPTPYIIDTLFKNRKKNARVGLTEIE